MDGLVGFTVEEVKAIAFAVGQAGYQEAEREILKRITNPLDGGES